MQDQISDMLTRIRNGQRAGLFKILLYKPTSKFCIKILQKLYKSGYLRGFIIKSKFPLEIEVLLKYDSMGHSVIKNIQRISKPGQRKYIKNKVLWNLKAGLGFFILTTSKGLKTSINTKFLNNGGEILFSIY